MVRRETDGRKRSNKKNISDQLCLFYLSDVLIGGQDHFIKSWRRDLDSLLESDGHHGSLKKEKRKKSTLAPFYFGKFKGHTAKYPDAD